MKVGFFVVGGGGGYFFFYFYGFLFLIEDVGFFIVCVCMCAHIHTCMRFGFLKTNLEGGGGVEEELFWALFCFLNLL